MKIRREEHMAGGNGHVIIKEILDAEQLNGKCGLYAQVTLEPGCSLGYHEHHGESETYYIIQGQGEYNDNGNNVDIDLEMTELAANEIYYSALTQIINAKLSSLNYVINR